MVLVLVLVAVVALVCGIALGALVTWLLTKSWDKRQSAYNSVEKVSELSALDLLYQAADDDYDVKRERAPCLDTKQ